MGEALERGQAMSALTRYGLGAQAQQRFETLSGGQQARLQILLLELGGATMLLLDEPTDNLDLESAEALEEALEAFDGTVLAVTHDRWFARGFDRFLRVRRRRPRRGGAGAGLGQRARSGRGSRRAPPSQPAARTRHRAWRRPVPAPSRTAPRRAIRAPAVTGS